MNPFQQYFLNIVTQHYADFSGRARRREFWMYTLITTILSLVIGFIDGLLGLEIGGSDTSAGIGILGLIFTLALFLPGLALTVRRLHDVGRSGWWLLIGLIPFVGWIVLFVFEVLDSRRETNKWGPDPKAAERV